MPDSNIDNMHKMFRIRHIFNKYTGRKSANMIKFLTQQNNFRRLKYYMKTSKRSRLLAGLLVLVMLITLLPTAAFAAETASAKQITSAEEFSSGQYVMLTNTGYAPGVLDGIWITAAALTANGDTIAAPAANVVWNITVDGDSVKLTDSNGVTVAPKGGNNNGISSGDYAWAWSFENGVFKFAGTGSDTVTLASNKGSDNKFRAYKNATVAGNPGGYPSEFTLFKLGESEPDPYPDIDKKYSVYEPVAAPEAGDTVIIYNAGNGAAVSSEILSNYYLTPVEMSVENGVIATENKTVAWTVDVKDGVYTFTQGDSTLTLGENNGKYNLNVAADGDTGWKLDACNADNNSYYLYSSMVKGTYGNVYIEYYAKYTEFSAYCTSTNKLTEKDFGMTFYKLVREGVAEEETGLPSAGDQIFIYNQSSQGVLALQDDNIDSPAITNAAAEVADGKATAANGAVVFTVEKNGDYFRFKNDTFGYLCSNGTGNNAFYTPEASEDADWTISTCGGGVGGWTLESRTAKFNGKYSQWLEYYADSYKSYSMYNVSDYTIYSFYFYPVANDASDITGGVVNKPTVIFGSLSDAFLGQAYAFSFEIDAPFGVAETTVTANGVEITADENGVYTVPADKVTGEKISITVSGKDNKDVAFSASVDVSIKDEPVIDSVTPAKGSETGDDKQPTIKAVVINAGENASVSLKLNGEEVKAEYIFADGVGTVSYAPAEPLTDGRVNAELTVTRTDGKTASFNWNFTVGKAQYQLYYGQLHSHTNESDGSGTLDQALAYVKALPESANVDFVAFTDHSNYFDTSGSANPEDALYDMSKGTAQSQQKWAEYKSKVAAFNEENAGNLVAVAGFEMTWSGGPGHINTFNTPGIVSRNNGTLNNKTSDAGMKAYYSLLSRADGANSISQFNHPGSTFGTFSDFSYWDAVIDSRIFLVEVGNGEGQIGAGGYYPSYEYYTMALDKGWHVAPTNNQDNHKGKWGNANDARDVILTDNFTEEGIYDAIRAMRLYSTEDKNLELYYTVNGLQLGSSITEVPEKLDISVQVSDPDGSDSISKVEVVVNSGKTIHTWSDPAELAKGDLSVSLDPDYSYYYIRVTEGDGDLAVTAPVWVGESLKLGISSVECGTSTPVTGEEIEISTTLFNSESTDALIKSITYTANGSQVIGTDTDAGTVGASENKTISFKYTPDKARLMKLTVTVVLEQDGKDYTFTKDIELDVLNADDLVYIGIDASHYNEYVAGNYKDSMGNFGNLAAGYSVRTVELKTSADLIAACSNDKYKALILTAPSRRLEAAQSDPKTYTDDEIAAIKAFNAAGGAVILAGWSDNYENYTVIQNDKNIKHMAETQNELLAALGSSLRIADDATYDDVRSAADKVDKWRLYFNTYGDSFLTNGVEFDPEHPYDRLYTEVFSHYGGASIYAIDANGDPTNTLPASVTPVVYGHSSTYSVDVDKDGLGGDSVPKYAYADGDNRLMVMASEQLSGKGLIVVSGAAFMSNFEVQATISDNGSEKNYSNYKICENLVQYLNPVKVTDIATVQKQTETGIKYTIEGIVTSNASGYDKDTAFFDCIYVQDETAGICCFPVAGDYKVGDKVRITGSTDFYQGEMELQVSSIQKIGEGNVEAKNVTAAQINDSSVIGTLVTIKGTVVSFELENGLIQTIMVKDADGNVARVFIDGYITKDNEVKDLAVEKEISVTGLASYDNTFNAPDGPFPRIRVRDRADVVVGALVEHSYIAVVTEPTCTEQGYTTHTCTNCGDSYVDSYTDPLGHKTELKNAKNATCTEAGYTGDEVCTVCGETIKAGTEIAALGHKTELKNAKAATCTRTGYTGDEVCTVCGETIKAGAEIPATGHDVVGGVCKNCGQHFRDPFTDIANNDLHDYIVRAAENGIVNGYPDGTYRPLNAVTRAQFITMIYRAAGSPEVKNTELKFADAKDIAKDFENAVAWGVENGIVLGYENGTFQPNRSISRAQMATFMYRYLKNVEEYDFGDVKPCGFADADQIAAPYADAVNAIVSAGIMNGMNATTFAPNGIANRGQAATVMIRAYDLVA